MAQPSVTQRPATWAGTSLPMLYKLTSTNSANAGYRLEVEIWDSTASAKIADAKCYANSVGVVTVDVAAFLTSSMSLDNEADLTTVDVTYTDNNWLKYYIKYQEVWTASSETQVDDVANLRYAVYGGLQVGNTNDLTDYIPSTSSKLFLSTGLRGVSGYPFLLSVIGGEGVLLEKYLAGVKIVEGGAVLTENAGNIVKIEETAYDRVDATVVKDTTDTWVNGRAVSGLNPFDSVSAGLATSAAVAAGDFAFYNFPFTGTPSKTETVIVRVTSTDLTGVVTVGFLLQDAAGGGASISGSGGSASVTYNGTYVLTRVPSAATVPAYKTIYLDNGSAGAVDFSVEVLNVAASETLSIDLEEECNTVLLQWRNSLGGMECFPFTINQEYTWNYSNRKAKRLTLYADNLTLTQWEAIQGLNTLGELYKTPIVEMTTSINRTSATIGQSVYVINSDGTKIGVNVIGQANTTNTKQKTHSAVVTIEYPELFLQ